MELIFYTAWVIAMLIVWGAIVRDDWRAYRKDSANLWSDIALLVSAVAGALTLALVIAAREYPGLRGGATAVFFGGFLGAFLAAGIVKWAMRRKRPLKPAGKP